MADFFRLSPPQPTPSGQSRPHLFPLRSLGAAPEPATAALYQQLH